MVPKDSGFNQPETASGKCARVVSGKIESELRFQFERTKNEYKPISTTK